MRIITLLLISVFGNYIYGEIQQYDCSFIDEELTYCPIPKSPRITELQEGHVNLRYIVLPDGSVSNIKTISSDSAKMWNETAIKTLGEWKYKTRQIKPEKTHDFKFEFAAYSNRRAIVF